MVSENHAMSDARVAFPTSLTERYKDPRFIGAGGASTVYAAHDSNLNKEVAIKILGPRPSGQKLLRFQQEAKVIGRLSHPNIVTAIDFGVVDENFAYMVMDLVGDCSLEAFISSGEEISVTKSIEIFRQIAIAMTHAHAHNVLHRDLKPGNVLLDTPAATHPRIKVADFGVAKIIGTPFFVTTGNIFIGTPSYMSPEQFRAQDVDERSDIYSFGCLMFETLKGTVPFPGDAAAELAEKHANEPVPPCTVTAYGEEIPNRLQEIIRKCLEKKPENRFDTFETVERYLSALSAEQSSSVRPVVQERAKLAAREPYLVSSTTSQYQAADTGATRKLMIAITTLVVSLAALICYSLTGEHSSFSLIGSETLSRTGSGDGTKDGSSKELEKKQSVDLSAQLEEEHKERRSWRNRDIQLPASMLKGSTDELLDRAKKQIDKKRYSFACGYLDHVLKLEPNNFRALKLRGDARKNLNDVNGALSDITAALFLRPDDSELLYRRAMLRRETSDLNGTIEDLNLAIEKEPNNSKYFFQRGDSYMEIGKTKEAFEDLTRSISLKPSEAAYRSRGKLSQLNGKFREAIDDFSRAMEANPGSAELRFLRGNSYNELGEYQKAVADYTAAISRNSGNANFYKMRANAYEQLGDPGKARADRSVPIDDFKIGR